MEPTTAAAMIDAGASPRELRQVIPDTREAAAYFGARLRDTYTYDRAAAGTQTCGACEARRASAVVQFRWKAVFTTSSAGALTLLLLPLGIVSWKQVSVAFGFETHHALCDACWARVCPRPVVRGVVTFVSITLAILGLFVASIGWGVLFLESTKARERPNWIRMGLVGTAALALGIVGQTFLGRVRLPRPLRRFARRPYVYHSAAVVSAAPAPSEQPTMELIARARRASAMTWQEAVAVLAVIAGLIFETLRYAPDISADVRRVGLYGLIGSGATFVFSVAWAVRRRSAMKRAHGG